MSALEDLFEIRRIVVALDAATSGTAFVEAAVDLARAVEAELEGVFIEDVALMRLAELPFVHELRLPTGLPQPFDLDTLERDVRLRAAGARRALESRAEQRNVRCSFRVVRGRIEAEVRAAAGTADLVILARSDAVTRHVRIASSAEYVARETGRSVLLLPARQAEIDSVVVAYDGTAASGRALAAAARFAAPSGGGAAPGLTVLCLGETMAGAREAEASARAALQPSGIAATFRAQRDGSGLAAALRDDAGTLSILPAELLSAGDAERLLAGAQGPVLFVR
jgi:nucleotide-binding universal stress UspA family protein